MTVFSNKTTWTQIEKHFTIQQYKLAGRSLIVR